MTEFAYLSSNHHKIIYHSIAQGKGQHQIKSHRNNNKVSFLLAFIFLRRHINIFLNCNSLYMTSFLCEKLNPILNSSIIRNASLSCEIAYDLQNQKGAVCLKETFMLESRGPVIYVRWLIVPTCFDNTNTVQPA